MKGRCLETLSHRYTHKVLRVERTFMVPKYGPTSQRDTITSFSASNRRS